MKKTIYVVMRSDCLFGEEVNTQIVGARTTLESASILLNVQKKHTMGKRLQSPYFKNKTWETTVDCDTEFMVESDGEYISLYIEETDIMD